MTRRLRSGFALLALLVGVVAACGHPAALHPAFPDAPTLKEIGADDMPSASNRPRMTTAFEVSNFM